MESTPHPASDEQEQHSGGYFDHCRRSEVAYLLSYEEWERGLSPADRARLGRASTPDLDDRRAMGSKRMVLGLERDVAESSAASECEWMVEDSAADVLREEFPELSADSAERLASKIEERVEAEAARRKAEALLAITTIFLDCSNLRLQAAGLSFCIGLPVPGYSTLSEWAAAHGVTRQALSKVARDWHDRLGLPEGPHLRDDSLCESYRAAQLKNHWRRKVAQ